MEHPRNQNHNPTSSFHAFWKQSPGRACTKREDPDALASLPRWAFGSSLGEKITCEWAYLGNLDHQQLWDHVLCYRENIDCLRISPHVVYLPPNRLEFAVWTLSPFRPRAPSLELSMLALWLIPFSRLSKSLYFRVWAIRALFRTRTSCLMQLSGFSAAAGTYRVIPTWDGCSG